MAANQHVVPVDGKWAVKVEGGRRASRVVATREEAVEVARRIAYNQGVAVVVHDTNGDVVGDDAPAERTLPRWLAIAEEIKRQAPHAPTYLRPRRADASVERVRELAGIIVLDGPVPSTDIFED